jgi:N-acetylglucosamine malate deacetylase 1
MEEQKADILAVGAHPDDVEIGIGGILHKLSAAGYRVAILDLTRGEMGTRGTVEERAEEAAEAARILGAVARENAELPDGALANNTDQQRVIIPFIRKYRPQLLISPMTPDRHPDHIAAHGLVRDANFYAGLQRIETGQERYRIPKVLFYTPYYDFEISPHFVVDITGHLEAKLDALRAFKSQFHNPDHKGPATLISSKEFWNTITARAVYWGSRAGVIHAEPLYAQGLAALDLPPGLEKTS